MGGPGREQPRPHARCQAARFASGAQTDSLSGRSRSETAAQFEKIARRRFSTAPPTAGGIVSTPAASPQQLKTPAGQAPVQSPWPGGRQAAGA